MRRFCFSIFLLIIVAINVSGCSRYDKYVPEVLAEIAKSGDNTPLSGITSYEWDTVYVVGPYESFDCSAIKRVPKKVENRLKMNDLYHHQFVLLFTLNQKFVSYSEVSGMTIDELGLKRESAYKPTTVIPFRDDEGIAFCYVNDKRPMFDGDMTFNKLGKWVEDHLMYPEEAKKEGIQGKVVIGFTVTKEGKLTDVKVFKGCHPLLDAEAVRVIETTAEKWSCGYNSFNGEPCDVTITCPVIFRL